MQESRSTLVKQIFELSSNGNKVQNTKGKLAFISVGTKFRNQLTQLMEKLGSTVGNNFYIYITNCKTKKIGISADGKAGKCFTTISVVKLIKPGY